MTRTSRNGCRPWGKKQYERRPFEVGELDGAAVLVGESEGGGLLSGLDHAPMLAGPMQIIGRLRFLQRRHAPRGLLKRCELMTSLSSALRGRAVRARSSTVVNLVRERRSARLLRDAQRNEGSELGIFGQAHEVVMFVGSYPSYEACAN